MKSVATSSPVKLVAVDRSSTPEELAWAFPDIDPMLIPFGYRVLVQIRRSQAVTRSGIHLPDESKETEKWNAQVAKVIAVGPMAYRDRKTGEPWPEGEWCMPGDYVRVPKYGPDRWEVPIQGAPQDPALFVVYDDLQIIGKVTGDPLAMKAYI